MTSTMPGLATLTVAAVLALTGCSSSGDDDAAATTTSKTTAASSAAAAGDELCVPLKVISDKDAESVVAVQTGWPATQAFFAENTDEVLAAYDDAIALGTDLTEDLQALRTLTEQTESVAAQSNSFEEFGTNFASQPGVAEAGQAGLRLNKFAEETCGFSTTSNAG